VRSASTGEEAGEWESSRSLRRRRSSGRRWMCEMRCSPCWAFIRQELEAMPDPTRREVDTICMWIDKVNKQLKPLSKTQELPPQGME
jgi:hypothetical protein